jgi:hypothetical protein
MTDDPGVEGSVARPGGVSYLAIPARDVARSAEFAGPLGRARSAGDRAADSWRAERPADGRAARRLTSERPGRLGAMVTFPTLYGG